MENKVDESDLSLGTFVDMDRVVFRKFLRDKNLGFLKGAENLLTVAYNNLTTIKNDLLTLHGTLEKGKDEEKRMEVELNINSIFSKMLMLEEKVFILREVQEQRSFETA